jgi:hypothetical protein
MKEKINIYINLYNQNNDLWLIGNFYYGNCW